MKNHYTYGKYIIKKFLGHDVAILFHPLIKHSDIVVIGGAVSAGFFHVDGVFDEHDEPIIEVSAHGHSVSVGAASRGEIDAELIKQVLEGT